MGKAVLDIAISVDGYIAGVNDADGGLHNWYFDPSNADRAIIDELIGETGALVMGRRSYDMGDKYDGYVDNPYAVPHFVLTHTPPERPAKGSTAFVFVTDGIESAFRQAQAAAGDKDVVVGGGAQTAQQFLEAGLIDEIQLHVVPVLIGDGLRLFEAANEKLTQLALVRTTATPNVTHLRYRVIR